MLISTDVLSRGFDCPCCEYVRDSALLQAPDPKPQNPNITARDAHRSPAHQDVGNAHQAALHSKRSSKRACLQRCPMRASCVLFVHLKNAVTVSASCSSRHAMHSSVAAAEPTEKATHVARHFLLLVLMKWNHSQCLTSAFQSWVSDCFCHVFFSVS